MSRPSFTTTFTTTARRVLMRLGVFLPTGNNGWILSETAPQYMPTFALNQGIVSRAESFGFSLGLGMISFRGYGGSTEHWDYTSEPVTQTAAVLATTSSMTIFASVGVLSIHPAMVARMAATINDVAPGRFGINITTGWHRAEYAQMGMWPGDDYFGYRYDYATEYATILRELLETGHCDFTGKHFQVEDCRVGFHPENHVPIAAAGASERGRRFAAQFADYNFTMAKDTEGIRAAQAQIHAAAGENGRDVRILTQRSVILDDTDELALKRIEHINAGADSVALANQKGHYAVDSSGTSSAAAEASIATYQAVDPGSASLFAGSPATVARKVNALAAVGGIDGLLFSFDDFGEGLDRFGDEVVPLLDFDIAQ
ncbi:LLM class flavin-dependent oxidoreductase [Cellulomonas sp. S1-8]|uniref:LLM class flavin-dependent oxidoreductase n=1 Tax=Cellulomonas sp. S1-8 TaxID=2904790 RepID=UPI002244E3D0|nr:LLM class flavin-dependent oxidoreductase [Cellulomonas sp. S1-8]UZN04154.1 LLM class flavin-dependent oxidoreductase [Cellulomonas sp. S1-8]